MIRINKKLLSVRIILILTAILTVLIWSNFIEPRWLEVTKHEVTIENLNPAWEGSKVAFISDFQVGMWLGNESTIGKAVDEVLKHKPEVLLIGGDFIYHPTDEDADDAADDWQEDDQVRTNNLIDKIIKLLSPLKNSDIEVLAVLGNHDYSMGKHSARMVKESALILAQRLRTLNIKVLHNETVEIMKDNQGLFFVGIAPYYPKFSNVDKAIENLGNQARVMFMHNANALEKTPGEKIKFAVAGHTHGGQLRFPGFPNWSWTSLVPQSPDEVKGDGWIPEYKSGKASLYVNRGIGFSTIPVRLNCRPELSVFTLLSRSN